MENGATILSDIDNASNNVINNAVEEQRQNRTGLTEAARRSIVRRRSALKLTAADDNPLSTSTWGLFEGGRNRGESKSFTLRRNNAPGTIKRMGTEITLERSFLSNRQPDVASSLPSGGTGAGNPKKRPPSRLMSFLANKNVGAGPPNTVKSMTLANNLWSSSMTDSSLGADGRGCKAISSTTELELGSRQGSSTNRGLSAFAALGAPPPAAALASSPRRPPTRRLLRPAIEDVAEAETEESGADCSSRLPTCGQQAQLSSVQPGVLRQLTGVVNGSTGSQPGRVGGHRPSVLGQMQHTVGDNSDRGSASADDEEDCWHEITASTLRDPVSGEQTLLVMQVDVSSRVRAERRIAEVLEAEHKLLESVFPRHVLELAATRHTKDASTRGFGTSKYSLAELPLAQNCASVATYHPMVTILFSDIIGFTSMCHEIPATKVMEFLNNLYSRLDSLLDVYGVYKVETIGDCYMVAGGLMARDADGFMTVRGSGSMDELHAAKVMSFAKAMLRETAEVLLPTTNEPVQMRIGLHSGPVMSGIVGSKMPRFCLFGDTVNTASRMESTCPPGCIQVSSATREFLLDEDWEATGGVMVKGKGKMDTFRWLSIEAESSPQGRTGGQRRPRRASSVACLNTAAHSRDASGSAATLAQVVAQANGFAATGVPSGPSSCYLSSAALGDAAQANRLLRPNNGCGRAASASIAFAAADGQPLAAFQATGARGLGSGASGGASAPNSKRKPHRTCSTTALGYRGIVRP